MGRGEAHTAVPSPCPSQQHPALLSSPLVGLMLLAALGQQLGLKLQLS